jgi:hypothetical protein
MDSDSLRNELLTSQWYGISPGNISYTSGSVGIGTNNPVYTLDVNGTGRFAAGTLTVPTILGTTTVGINTTVSPGTTPLQVFWNSSKNTTGWALAVGDTLGYNNGNVNPNLFTVLYNALANGNGVVQQFGKGGVNSIFTSYQYNSGGTDKIGWTWYGVTAYTQLCMLSNGRVGIGTATPTYKLDVNGYVRCNSRAEGFLITLDGATWDNTRWWQDGASTYLDFGGMESGFKIRGNNDNSNPFGSQTYTEQLKIMPRTGTGSTFGTGGVAFAMAGCAIDRTWDNYPCISVFNVAGNSATLQGEFRVHGAAMSYASYPDASGADFSVNFRIDGATYFTSDKRAKSNITSITDALDIVMKLDGKRFQRINNNGDVQEHVSENSYKFGFIAQDLQAEKIDELYLHYPNEDDGTDNYNNSYSVDYASLVAVLVNAMKDQQAQINLLKSRLDAHGL